MLGPDALLAPLQRALAASGLAEADLWVHRRRAAITRYSHSSIHQNAVSDETSVHARAIIGSAVGGLTAAQTIKQGKRRCVIGFDASTGRGMIFFLKVLDGALQSQGRQQTYRIRHDQVPTGAAIAFSTAATSRRQTLS